MPGRWREILRGLREGGVFSCHKTVEWDDEGEQASTGLYCSGALEWQEKHGCTSQYARVAERLSPSARPTRRSASARDAHPGALAGEEP